MRGIKFEVNTGYNPAHITAQVSDHGFTPEGRPSEWEAQAKEFAEKYSIKEFDLYYETQDKQTGHCSNNFLKHIVMQ